MRELHLHIEEAHQREDLLKMKRLPMVDDIERAIGAERLFPVFHRRDIRRRIEKGAIALLDEEGLLLLLQPRRDLLRPLALLLAPEDRLRASIFARDAALHELAHDAFERVVISALAEIEIEMHIEERVDLVDRLPRHVDEFFPERAVLAIAVLKLLELEARGLREGLIFFGARRGRLIDALKLDNRIGFERRPIAIFAHPDDEEAKLRAPIAEVIVADHLMPAELKHARDRIADDGRAEMPNVHLLRDIRP